LRIPAEAQQRAAQLLRGRRGGPMVGIHASGGRPIKQWEVTRFAEVAAMLVASRGATIVLTGAPGDRAIVDLVRSAIPATNAIDIAGEADLLTLAAVLQQIDVLVTGDTGPMHLAAAVGTPVVAVFGPSDPARYAPRGSQHRIIRIDLPCSPCNRIRLPPERCSGHTPDCLAGIDAVTVFDAAARVLDARMSA
jgi:ADP-heptose:LPS heptosyltransferase